MIGLWRELVKLPALNDLEVFVQEWVGFFPSTSGWPVTPPRLGAGLPFPQRAYRSSLEAAVVRWVENPYGQDFTGETFFQDRRLIDPSALTRWRNRIGEEGVEWSLTPTIKTLQSAGGI
jgi:IS5 family transposase